MEEDKEGKTGTCEGVDDETEDHGDHRDEDPVGEPLVLHAAVDGDGRLVALERNTQTRRVIKNPSKHKLKTLKQHSTIMVCGEK